MEFTLSYRRGSFALAENYASRLGAIARTCALLEAGGSYAFRLELDGILLLNTSEFVSECREAGRMPHVAEPASLRESPQLPRQQIASASSLRELRKILMARFDTL